MKRLQLLGREKAKTRHTFRDGRWFKGLWALVILVTDRAAGTVPIGFEKI
ncbi:MAG: hypothetical protein KIH08_00910 [Candidatus Freyarchaeota archaeon]|nr:hypothetical protein [Candidatus Jordarchaeia archaeon]MBS7268114.1 hypothetical protein [Candidatus Jordarchaeia archaeon]MBS7278983.1 hypothetical protein [Candidatus Jordarchaeia archaeon]